MKNVILLFILIPVFSFSQYDVEGVKKDSVKTPKINPFKLKEKIYVGSGLNLLLGTTTFIYLSPQIGYDILPKLSAGVSTLYQYYSVKYSNSSKAFSNSFGLGTFVRYRPVKPLILETSINHYWTNFSNSFKQQSNSWMLGVGYARSMGDKSYYQIMLQYDFLRDMNVPEPSIISTVNWRLYYKFGIVFYLSNN
jgi:hypothetical protein